MQGGEFWRDMLGRTGGGQLSIVAGNIYYVWMFHESSNFNHFIIEETSYISKEQTLNKESEYISRNLRSRYKVGDTVLKRTKFHQYIISTWNANKQVVTILIQKNSSSNNFSLPLGHCFISRSVNLHTNILWVVTMNLHKNSRKRTAPSIH